MSRADLITRLRAADPIAGREPLEDPALEQARILALQSTTELPAGAPVHDRASRSRRSRLRRAAAMSMAALALPGGALAAGALFGPGDVERGLPDGARVLNGTDPKCTEVEAGSVYDCTLTTPPPEAPSGAGAPARTWLNAVSLMADRDELVNGGCVAQTTDGMTWRCYVGSAAVREWILDARLLGMPIHDECVEPVGAKPGEPGDATPRPAPAVNPDDGLSPGEGPTEAQSSHAIFFCAIRGTVGSAVVVRNPGHPRGRPARSSTP